MRTSRIIIDQDNAKDRCVIHLVVGILFSVITLFRIIAEKTRID